MRRVAMLAACAALSAPVLLAGPAYASTTDPIASEPPGGATCAPGLPTTNCGQDTGATPTPKPSSSTASTSSGGRSNTPTSLPRTGTTLPRTGPEDAARTGLVGLSLLGAGLVIVAATRRRAEA